MDAISDNLAGTEGAVNDSKYRPHRSVAYDPTDEYMLRPCVSGETDEEDVAGSVGMMSVLEQPDGRSRVLTQPGGIEQCLIVLLGVAQQQSAISSLGCQAIIRDSPPRSST